MTQELYDELKETVGRKLKTGEWKKIIAENFEVSDVTAGAMTYAMIDMKMSVDRRRIDAEEVVTELEKDLGQELERIIVECNELTAEQKECIEKAIVDVRKFRAIKNMI